MTSALTNDRPGAAPAAARAFSDRPAWRPVLVPVPDCEPPFDDERSAVNRLQRLRAERLAAPAPAVAVRRPLRAPDNVTDAKVPGWSKDPDVGVRRTATAELPTAQRSGPVLGRALIEVLCGQRPVSQLRVHCAPEVFAGLQSRRINQGPLGHLLTVRTSEPADGVAEVCVVFRRADRVQALAFRIQGVDGRWRITALQTG